MELKAQQKEAIGHLREWKVGALFMEAGTGKTRVACELVNSVPGIDYVLWIGPFRTLTPGSESVISEVAKWGGFNCGNVRYIGVESIQQSDRIYLEALDEIKRHRKSFAIVDESIKIKNAEAKRTKRVLEIGQYAEYKLILNGTPITRNILDLYSQMEFLSPRILGMTQSMYKDTFCRYTVVTKKLGCRKWRQEYITGYENIDYLYSLIRHYVYQCDLHLNVTQNYHEIGFSITEEERDEYERLKEYYLNLETLYFYNNNIFIEMTQKMQHSYCLAADKFVQLDALFRRIDEAKTIIFCKYLDSKAACEKRYPKARVLTYQKEGLGLNLQEYCNTVYFDKTWDMALRVQSARRTFRMGQNLNCQYYDMTGYIGLEHLIDRNIEKKVSMSEYFKHATKREIAKAL